MKRVINKFIVSILSATFLLSGFKIVNYYYEAYKQKELFDNVENKINKKVNGKTDVKGKTVQEAMEVTNKAVMEALDGLPPVKVHCSLLAEEAIHAALWDYAQKNGITIEGLQKPKSDIHEGEEDEAEEY